MGITRRCVLQVENVCHGAPLNEITLTRAHSEAYCEAIAGKIPDEQCYDTVLTDDARVLLGDGRLLCVYRRGAIPQELRDTSYVTLHSLKGITTGNRGLAGGVPVPQRGSAAERGMIPPRVSSVILGSFDRTVPQPYCRLTAWTGREWDQWEGLFPYFEAMGEVFQQEVPERYQVQMNHIRQTHEDWRIGHTPFTTITVNNTYPTGIHTDKGDLDAGFSCLSVIRRGEYTGGLLVFPKWRVAVDMQDGDQILMDAHQWHGNTRIVKETADAERISVVAYFRTEMVRCGSADTEFDRAAAHDEVRGKRLQPELL